MIYQSNHSVYHRGFFCHLTPSKSEVLLSASLSTWMRWLSMAETRKIIYRFIVIQYYMPLLCLFRDIFHNKSHRVWVEESVRRFRCILKEF